MCCASHTTQPLGARAEAPNAHGAEGYAGGHVVAKVFPDLSSCQGNHQTWLPCLNMVNRGLFRPFTLSPVAVSWRSELGRSCCAALPHWTPRRSACRMLRRFELTAWRNSRRAPRNWPKLWTTERTGLEVSWAEADFRFAFRMLNGMRCAHSHEPHREQLVPSKNQLGYVCC